MQLKIKHENMTFHKNKKKEITREMWASDQELYSICSQ